MKALVTGGTGFIGSHLVEALLRRNWDLRVVAKDRMYGDDLGAELVIADLRDCDALAPLLRDVDVVFHIAGLTRARRNADYYVGNHLATRDLLCACRRHGDQLQRFVYVSSLTAVGPRLGKDEVTESTGYHPVSHYGRSKMMAEIEVMDAAAHFPVTIIRPSAVYGPRDRDIFRYFKMIKSGIELLMGSGQNLVNLVHVDDVVQGILRAAEHPAGVNEAFFIGSEDNYPTEVICGAIAEAMHKQPMVFHLPEFMLYLVGYTGEALGRIAGRQVLFNAQKVREAVQKAWTCSISKAQQRIGFMPSVPLPVGMETTFEWYREQKWL
ncbi:MAG: NAD-dependent epimerase/dehydratase family protein [Bacteroidetes bacterium]|nr:NAD-dependent epimerase/dehydratase family protein [Bacteroidota bacterium]